MEKKTKVQKFTFSLNSADRTYFSQYLWLNFMFILHRFHKKMNVFILKISSIQVACLYDLPTRKQPMRQKAQNKQHHWHFSPMASPLSRD